MGLQARARRVAACSTRRVAACSPCLRARASNSASSIAPLRSTSASRNMRLSAASGTKMPHCRKAASSSAREMLPDPSVSKATNALRSLARTCHTWLPCIGLQASSRGLAVWARQVAGWMRRFAAWTHWVAGVTRLARTCLPMPTSASPPPPRLTGACWAAGCVSSGLAFCATRANSSNESLPGDGSGGGGGGKVEVRWRLQAEGRPGQNSPLRPAYICIYM